MKASTPDQQAQPPRWPLPGAEKLRHAVGSRPTLRLWLRRVAITLLTLIVLLAGFVGIAYWRLSATVTQYAGSHFNQGHNGVWLEHAWAGQPHTDADYDALAARLKAEQITYVYAHVGPLDSDGTIPDDRAPNAAALAAALHARMPGVRVLAWIGQLERASGYPADETVDLEESSVRTSIAKTAAHFVADLGYDGVHYDIEPIVNNNPRFLDLLDETRVQLPPGAIISLSGQKWAPNATFATMLHNMGKADAWWTSYYYAAVAKHCDQIVALVYNTAMPTPTTYQLAVKQETANILSAVRSAANPPQVLIGLPTYPGDNFWFHDTAENMRTGLSGVIAGLNSDRDTSPFTGVAIYRYALTSDDDWNTYDKMWLGK